MNGNKVRLQVAAYTKWSCELGVFYVYPVFSKVSVSFYKGFIFSSFDMKPYNKLLLFGRVFNTKLPFIMRGRFSFNLRILGELYEKL